MTLDLILGAVIVAVLAIYLVFALLRPEQL